MWRVEEDPLSPPGCSPINCPATLGLLRTMPSRRRLWKVFPSHSRLHDWISTGHHQHPLPPFSLYSMSSHQVHLPFWTMPGRSNLPPSKAFCILGVPHRSGIGGDAGDSEDRQRQAQDMLEVRWEGRMSWTQALDEPCPEMACGCWS